MIQKPVGTGGFLYVTRMEGWCALLPQHLVLLDDGADSLLHGCLEAQALEGMDPLDGGAAGGCDLVHEGYGVLRAFGGEDGAAFHHPAGDLLAQLPGDARLDSGGGQGVDVQVDEGTGGSADGGEGGEEPLLYVVDRAHGLEHVPGDLQVLRLGVFSAAESADGPAHPGVDVGHDADHGHRPQPLLVPARLLARGDGQYELVGRNDRRDLF